MTSSWHPLPGVELRTAPAELVLWGREPARLRDWLSAPEQGRYDAFSDEAAARDFLAARLLARILLSEVGRLPEDEVSLVQTCPRCGADGHGPPRPVGIPLHVSWSHSSGYVAAAVSTQRRVGVDVERAGRTSPTPSFLATAFPSVEADQVLHAADPSAELLRLWTLKESVVKLGGDLTSMTRRTLAELALEVGASHWWSGEDGSFVVAVATAGLLSCCDPPGASQARATPGPSRSCR